MKNFWSYIQNNRFAVGCTGQSVYVYDPEGRELACFRGLKYAYVPLFCPQKPLLAIKSTEPWLAFYDLDHLTLLQKLRLRKPNHQSQDAGCCFTKDGEAFVNLEYQNDLTSHLVVYDTREFAEQARLFAGERLVLGYVEPAADGDGCFLLGYERPETINNIEDNFYFVARLTPQGGLKRRALSAERYFELSRHKAWELSGFTAKKAQWTFVPPEEPSPEPKAVPLESVFAAAGGD